MHLTDSVVVITGASRGLGKELARAYAEKGARVVVSSVPGEELEAVAKELAVRAIACDVTNESEVRSLAEQVKREFGRIDVWVNNAGVGIPHAPFFEQDIAEAHRMMEVNFFGTVYGSREALRVMQEQGSGAIVNILSSRALHSSPRSALYSATKWAARGFTDALRSEAHGSGVHVLAVYPGGMRTSFFDGWRPNEYDGYMDPRDVADAIVENILREHPEEEFIIDSE